MRVPIQRTTQGNFIAVLDFEDTPPGFEDTFEQSRLVKRYINRKLYGEFNEPDLTALTGNPIAQLSRRLSIEETRVCLYVIDLRYINNRYVQIELIPQGPFGSTMLSRLQSNEPCYLTFRVEKQVNDDGDLRVVEIGAADFTLN